MADYLISVFHRPGAQSSGTVYQDEEAMKEAFRKVEAFNEHLRATGAWIAAGGLMPPETAVIAHPDGAVTHESFPQSEYQLGGFWLISANSDDRAQELAQQAAKACGNAVELRRLSG